MWFHLQKKKKNVLQDCHDCVTVTVFCYSMVATRSQIEQSLYMKSFQTGISDGLSAYVQFIFANNHTKTLKITNFTFLVGVLYTLGL